MTCPKCGASNPELATRCANCDGALPGSRADSTWGGGKHVSQTPLPVSSLADAVTGAAFGGGAGNHLTALGVSPARTKSESEVDFGPRYRVEGLLGQGGMGAVYKAYDLDLHRTVALKLVRPDLMIHPQAMQRFKQELLLASKISHKNILRIHDLGDAAGTKFISMAFVDGSDLHRILQTEGKLSVERTLKITKQLCAALEAAHGENVVHRDMKPQNIMLDKYDHVYVSDFGLAKSIESEGGGMTMTGELLGTPRYMAPEQIECKPVDGRTDLYALGLIVYEMLTGDIPFKAESTYQLMYKRANEVPPAPNLANPDIPEWLNHVVMKCLERDPSRRYQSAAELLEDIKAERAPEIVSTPVQKKGHSKQILLAVVAAVVVVGAVFAGMLLRGRLVERRSAAAPKSLTVLVGDFSNHTGDPVFDGTLEPMFNVALEGASFVNAYNRGTARKLAEKLPNPTDKLDEGTARLIAVNQGVNAVVTGEISRRGDVYSVSAMALDSATGNVLAKVEATANSKEQVLGTVPKLAAPIRQALGDTTPASVQFEKAAGAFTATSLEAVHYDAVGLEQQFAGKSDDALGSFAKATELDPNFARAYAGMSAVSRNLGRPQDAEKYINLAMEHIDRLTERERYRVRGGYYIATSNWQKCVEEYGDLVKQFPGDNTGYINLAACYQQLRKLPEAVAAGRRAVEIAPKGAFQRLNLSFYLSYSGDFKGGEQEARAALELNPSSEPGILALAEAQLGQGQLSQVSESYQKLEKVSAVGASMANISLADLASYQSRFGEAVRLLENGIAADLAAKNPENAADKYAASAREELLRGQKSAALIAADRALANSKAIKIRFLAARIFAEEGQVEKAQHLAATLASELATEPQAYGKIIEGDLSLKRGDARQAIKDFTDANNLLDTWIGRLELGRAYLEAGAFVEADAEFERCISRRGEALELFMDNVPTYNYFPAIYYYQGRAREGLKSPGFADSYRMYLSIRGNSGEDPVVAEIQRRLGQ